MKKSIYLWSIGMATAICMVVGLAYHIFGSGKYEERTEAIEQFSEIEAGTEIMDIKIVAGDDYEIRYRCDETSAPFYEVKDGVLIITQENRKGFLVGQKNKNLDLTVTVPREAVLKTINVIADVGNIRLIGIKADKGEIESDIGDVKLENCDFTDLRVVSDIGDIETEFVGSSSDYTLDLSSSIGEIELNGQEIVGDYYEPGTTEKMIRVIADIGDVEMNFGQ